MAVCTPRNKRGEADGGTLIARFFSTVQRGCHAKLLLTAALVVVLAGCVVKERERWSALPGDRAEVLRTAVAVPAGMYDTGSREPGCYAPETVKLAAFRVWPVEVPAAWWQAFLGEPPDDRKREPAAQLSYDDAQAFCAWFSERYDVHARLPTRTEWEVAARSGTPGVVYPWGWSSPEGRAAWGTTGVSAVACFAPNPWGLYDLVGNVAEWVQTDPGTSEAPVMGGSWAETDPRYQRISHRLVLPKTYRGRDVGFRIVLDTE